MALYVLGLSLLAIGIALSIITQTETRYREIFGQQIPHQEKVQPYVGVGILVLIGGTVAIITAFTKDRAH
jgi:hypothetical protein